MQMNLLILINLQIIFKIVIMIVSIANYVCFALKLVSGIIKHNWYCDNSSLDKWIQFHDLNKLVLVLNIRSEKQIGIRCSAVQTKFRLDELVVE